MARETMRYLLPFLLAFAACSSAPPEPSVASQATRSPQEIVQAFEKFRPTGLKAAAAVTPQGNQTLTKGQISVTISGHYGVAQTRDKNWIVHVPDSGAVVVSYSTTDGSCGAVLNVRGNNQTPIQNRQLSTNYPVVPTDALIVASSATTSDRSTYWPAPGGSACDEMMSVVFVPYSVRPGLLRPPAIGDGFLPRFLRSVPIDELQVDVAKLPRVVELDALPIQWAAWGKGKPSLAYYENIFKDFHGDCYDGWGSYLNSPQNQNPGYGSNFGFLVSQALCMLCTTKSVEEKRNLAILMTQWGFDLVGAFADGRRNDANGGHMQGRKALIVLSGHLLNVPWVDPSAFVPMAFQEDHAYYTGNPAWWDGYPYGYVPRSDIVKFLHLPPNQWTQGDRGNVWFINGYLQHGVGCQVGTAAAMKLMGLTREMGTAHYGMVARWMNPPASVVTAMAAVGVTLNWGQDYSLVLGEDFCETVWNIYAKP